LEVINIKIEVKTAANRTSRRTGNPSLLASRLIGVALLNRLHNPACHSSMPLYPCACEALAQNKPNPLNPRINTTSFPTTNYNKKSPRPTRKNKPNQTQLVAAKPRTKSRQSRDPDSSGPDPSRTTRDTTSDIRNTKQKHLPAISGGINILTRNVGSVLPGSEGGRL